MLADYLFSGIALDTLRSRIPVRNVSLWIDEIDGVISYALQQDAELVLCLPDCGCLPLGEFGQAPVIERRCQGEAEEQDGGPADGERKMGLLKGGVAVRGTYRGHACEGCRCHSRVMHAGNGKAHGNRCNGFAWEVLLPTREPERHYGRANRDHD